MELDELKHIWNKVPADNTPLISGEDILVSENHKPKNMMVMVRRRFLWENIISFLLFVPMVFKVLTSYHEIGGYYIVISIASALYFVFRFIQFQQVISYNESLLEYIKKSIRLIKSYILVARVFILTLTPISMIYGFYSGVMAGAQLDTFGQAMYHVPFWIPLVLGIIFTSLSYLLIYFLYRWLYGKPLNYFKQELSKLNKQ